MSGLKFNELAGHTRTLGPQISFERPELSPILASVKNNKDRQEFIRILQTGMQRLTETPRADMPGFVPCLEHQAKLELYNSERAKRINIMALIEKGEKVYDK